MELCPQCLSHCLSSNSWRTSVSFENLVGHRWPDFWTLCSTVKTENLSRSAIVQRVLILGICPAWVFAVCRVSGIEVRPSRTATGFHYPDPFIKNSMLHCKAAVPNMKTRWLVEALHYRSEGRGFDSRWCHWNFSLA